MAPGGTGSILRQTIKRTREGIDEKEAQMKVIRPKMQALEEGWGDLDCGDCGCEGTREEVGCRVSKENEQTLQTERVTEMDRERKRKKRGKKFQYLSSQSFSDFLSPILCPSSFYQELNIIRPSSTCPLNILLSSKPPSS